MSALIVSLLMFNGPAMAHHGNSAYDETKEVTVSGTVTEFQWANPHVQIYLDSKDSSGHAVHWAVETLSPGKLVRCGWKRNSLQTGDQITVTVIGAKTGAPVGFLHKLVFADGRQLGIQEAPQQY